MKTFEEVMELTRTVSSNTALEDPEAKALYECCMGVLCGGLVVEIGCQLGRSSSLIAQVAKEECFHHSHIDPYIENPEYLGPWIAMMHKIGHPFTLHCMKSDRAVHLIQRQIDLLFVDGDHEYKAVMEDLSRYGYKIAKGGILAMHDYGRDSLPGVYRAATEFLNDDEWDQVQVAGTLGVWRRR